MSLFIVYSQSIRSLFYLNDSIFALLHIFRYKDVIPYPFLAHEHILATSIFSIVGIIFSGSTKPCLNTLMAIAIISYFGRGTFSAFYQITGIFPCGGNQPIQYIKTLKT